MKQRPELACSPLSDEELIYPLETPPSHSSGYALAVLASFTSRFIGWNASRYLHVSSAGELTTPSIRTYELEPESDVERG